MSKKNFNLELIMNWFNVNEILICFWGDKFMWCVFHNILCRKIKILEYLCLNCCKHMALFWAWIPTMLQMTKSLVVCITPYKWGHYFFNWLFWTNCKCKYQHGSTQYWIIDLGIIWLYPYFVNFWYNHILNYVLKTIQYI